MKRPTTKSKEKTFSFTIQHTGRVVVFIPQAKWVIVWFHNRYTYCVSKDIACSPHMTRWIVIIHHSFSNERTTWHFYFLPCIQGLVVIVKLDMKLFFESPSKKPTLTQNKLVYFKKGICWETSSVLKWRSWGGIFLFNSSKNILEMISTNLTIPKGLVYEEKKR